MHSLSEGVKGEKKVREKGMERRAKEEKKGGEGRIIRTLNHNFERRSPFFQKELTVY